MISSCAPPMTRVDVTLPRRRIDLSRFFGGAWCTISAKRATRLGEVDTEISAMSNGDGITLALGDLTRCGSVECVYLTRASAFELADQLKIGPDPRRPRR